MMSWLRRAVRVVVLLAFLGGGGGIPAIDAIVYHHTNPADSPQGVHVEPLGASCHTDTCLTGFSAVHGAHRVPPIAGPLFVPVAVAQAPSHGAPDLPTSRLLGPGLPRSPPAS